MGHTLKMRNEVDENLTWDLSLIYKDTKALEADADLLRQKADHIVKTYKGNLNTAENIVSCLKEYEAASEIMILIIDYTSMAVEVDYYNSENQTQSARYSDLVASIQSDLSFIDSEIACQNEDVLNAALENAGSCKGYLSEILRGKPHLLHPEAERVLAAISGVTDAPFAIYNNLKMADMKFDNFTAAGKEWPLGYSLFEDNYEYDPDTEVRRAAFDAFSAKIREYENGTASVYNTYCQYQNKMAQLRGFKDIFEPDLFKDHVTEDMYHRQIDLIMKYLAPHMQKYAKLIQKIHHLDRMTYADLKLPVDPEYTPAITIEEAQKYIEDGLSIMGEDYHEMISTAFRERWIDFARNQGKSTGGFCESPYGKGSFILLSWNGKMSDVFTLAHELGHAGHFMYCNEAQGIFDTDVATYFVECPSTMNELLMAHYMLKTSDDKRFRRWVLSNMVGNTYYHNFVTHLLEAAFQREVYKVIESGDSVQADTLNSIMHDTLAAFWCDAVELTPGAELTWMRQPHYYLGLYSYSYSAGLTIGTQMCKRIENEGAPAVEDWKKVLKAGGTLSPTGLAALGGIDITTDAALMDTIATIGEYIDEICQLTEEIGY